eukprot:scaffold3870_cov160-Skeletonema_menzelii.AAC.3
MSVSPPIRVKYRSPSTTTAASRYFAKNKTKVISRYAHLNDMLDARVQSKAIIMQTMQQPLPQHSRR